MAHPLRTLPHCLLAETVGTFLLVFFGLGSVHSAVLTGGLVGLWQVAIVWGISIALAIYAVGAVSGAHINPAISISLATWRLFPWSRVLPYIAAQLVGAFLAAAALYAIYSPYLEAKEAAKGVTRGGPGSEVTAMCYGEYFPNPGPFAGDDEPFDAEGYAAYQQNTSEWSACLAELLGTAILALVVLAVTDAGNGLQPGKLAPAFIGLTVAGLICVLAPLTQACFNPARDFGPRLFAYWAGWGEIAIPGPRGGILTVYVLSPIVGAILGAGLYQLLLRPGDPSPAVESA